MKRLKRIKYLLVFLLFGILIGISLCDFVVEKNAESRYYTSADLLEKNNVGLLLGTSKYLKNGRVNLYYKFRVQAAVALFKAKKINFILVSGDNGVKEYDEPTEFKKDLIALGVPEGKIFLDYAGFRTLDSIVRAKKIFGQSSITIISQKFHLERALYLADHFELKAIGYIAKDVSYSYGFKIRIREYLARVKMFIDLLIGVQPKFLGKPVEIQ